MNTKTSTRVYLIFFTVFYDTTIANNVDLIESTNEPNITICNANIMRLKRNFFVRKICITFV